MFKISRKVEYALIALRHLQGLEEKELASAKELAKAYGVPQELLAKILQLLAKKKYHRCCQRASRRIQVSN